ncbi:MAG: hypothetical protein HQL56_06440 [Magnetococcales bacterium]|nr:hypothetical protein [Magnetococcales bacterium]
MNQAASPHVSPPSAGTEINSGLIRVVVVILLVALCVILLQKDPYYFWRDDYQSYFLPTYIDSLRSFRQGEWPLLSPHSWLGGALASEYQAAVFAPVPVLLTAFGELFRLDLPHLAAFIAIGHLLILALGVVQMGVQRHWPGGLAVMAALAVSLNGWIMTWGAINWIGAVTSFAWIPWFWWSLERALARRDAPLSLLWPVFFLYLVLSAGWPFTVFMALLLSLWLGLRHLVETRSLRLSWPVPLVWLLGGCFASPSLLMLVEYFANSRRASVSILTRDLTVPATAWAGLALPSNQSLWSVFLEPLQRPNLEMICGLFPILLVVSGFVRSGPRLYRSHPWEVGFFALLILVCSLPSMAPLRWSYRWLPLFHLALAVLAVESYRSFRPGPGWRNNPALTGLMLLAGLALVEMLFFPLADQAEGLILGSLLLCLVWLAVEHLPVQRASLKHGFLALGVFLALAGSYLSLYPFRITLCFPIDDRLREAVPLDPKRRYLGLYTVQDYFRFGKGNHDGGVGFSPWSRLRPGNSALYAGLETINGYSPIAPLPISHLFHDISPHGMLAREQMALILESERKGGLLLPLMGVDGLLLGNDSLESALQPLLDTGRWILVDRNEEGAVLHRQQGVAPRIWSIPEVTWRSRKEMASLRTFAEAALGREPFAMTTDARIVAEQRSRFAPVAVSNALERRNSVQVEVRTAADREGLVVFSRAWRPEYKAWLDGEARPVVALQGLLPAVLLPAGAHGRLELVYAPDSLRLGLILAGGAGFGCLVWFFVVSRRKREVGG